MRQIGVATLLALFAQVACGGESNGGQSNGTAGTDGGATSPASHFVDELADQLCMTADQCCLVVGHAAPSDCVVRARQQLHDDIDPEIVAGATFNADEADKCLGAYRDLAQGCPPMRDPFPPCHQTLIGTAPPGEPCTAGCAPSTEGDVVCAFTVTLGGDAGQVKSPSICQVEITASPGGTCDVEMTKPVLYVCDEGGGSWCFGGVCSTPVANGGACHGADCVSGAYCKDGVCQTQIAIGAPCTGIIQECPTGSSCDPSSMTCRGPDRWKKLCGGSFD